MIVALAILLHDAPAFPLLSCHYITTQFAVVVAETPAFDVNISPAYWALFPVGIEKGLGLSWLVTKLVGLLGWLFVVHCVFRWLGLWGVGITLLGVDGLGAVVVLLA